MMVVIRMSLEHYNRFIGRCDSDSQEESVLKRGVIGNRTSGDRSERIIEITCTVDEAQTLLDRARNRYIEAVRDIETALADPRYI